MARRQLRVAFSAGHRGIRRVEGSLLEHLHHELRLYVVYLLQCHLQRGTILIGSFVQNPFESEGSMQRDETVFHLHFDVHRYL
jgi:hypothetical protein